MRRPEGSLHTHIPSTSLSRTANVTTEGATNVAGMAAKGVGGVFSVNNNLAVEK